MAGSNSRRHWPSSISSCFVGTGDGLLRVMFYLGAVDHKPEQPSDAHHSADSASALRRIGVERDIVGSLQPAGAAESG
jgi:hypothetical protein